MICDSKILEGERKQRLWDVFININTPLYLFYSNMFYSSYLLHSFDWRWLKKTFRSVSLICTHTHLASIIESLTSQDAAGESKREKETYSHYLMWWFDFWFFKCIYCLLHLLNWIIAWTDATVEFSGFDYVIIILFTTKGISIQKQETVELGDFRESGNDQLTMIWDSLRLKNIFNPLSAAISLEVFILFAFHFWILQSTCQYVLSKLLARELYIKHGWFSK